MMPLEIRLIASVPARPCDHDAVKALSEDLARCLRCGKLLAMIELLEQTKAAMKRAVVQKPRTV